jgi:hypothetical protein
MRNMFFGTKLGSVGAILGLDYPVALEGSRATINQGSQWTEPDGRELRYLVSLFLTYVKTQFLSFLEIFDRYGNR